MLICECLVIYLNYRKSTNKTAPKRLEGGGRPVQRETVDESVLRWFRDQREKKFRVSRNLIRQKAKEICGEEDFKVANCVLC
uniref:Transposase n=1 Tax=Caenorhabditis elegans TaxID=6239 RepID=Q22861_CAEEL|nr:transposase [Caenorhabditis elegans]